MPRERKYANSSDRYRAYRERKKLAAQASEVGTQAGASTLFASLADAVRTAAAEGFEPAKDILGELEGDAPPEQVAAALALWLKLQAATWEKREKWENRRSGWNEAWMFTRPVTSEREHKDRQERAFAYWDQEQEEVPGFGDGPTFREIQEQNAKTVTELFTAAVRRNLEEAF